MKSTSLRVGVLAIALAACDANGGNGILEVQSDLILQNHDLTGWISSGKVAIADPFRPEVPAFYQYQAKLDKNGTKGSFRYETQLLAGPLVASGDVVCMNVVELIDGVKKARFGGIIRESNRPEFPPGHAFIWNVTDRTNANDKAGEFASPLLGFDAGAVQAFCASGGFFPESPVDGFIHLHRTGQGS